ncbi:MAG: homoserine kinase [Proteobacteria bacterium]|nr:homoserine kinase [Pseudomonadota bacterium]
MAVYTKVPRPALEKLLSGYELGRLVSMHEILEGVENTNYLIVTSSGKYILTLYEKRVKREDLPFFIELMRHGALKGIPCPLPLADRNGEILQTLRERPAAIVRFLNGEMTTAITPAHCRQVGEALAHFHRATQDFEPRRANALSLAGWEKLVSACESRVDQVAPGLAEMITGELSYLKEHWQKAKVLPQGVIHADLFPDNVFFENDKLCGLIDFYFSCNDLLAYDLAVCVNSWCFEDEKTFSHDRMEALISGYESGRPLSEAEREALPLLLRGAALRFLLTRLYDKLNHPLGTMVKVKDPLEYRGKLLFFRNNSLTRIQAA